MDVRFEQLYDPESPIAAATTNAYAEIAGLNVWGQPLPPYVLVIDGTNAIDLNTSVAPVIKKLVTVITLETLSKGQPIFATPYTTLAYQMLREELGSNGSSNDLNTTYYNDSFLSGVLAGFNQMIGRSLGFGMAVETDIFTTPPIVTASTTSIAQQQLMVNYRAAIEVLSSMLHSMFLLNPTINTDTLLQLLAIDLYSDGVIDKVANGDAVIGIHTGVLSQNPMYLTIANTKYWARDIVALIDAERALVGHSADIPFLKDDIVVDLQPATLDSTSAVDNPPQIGYSAPVGAISDTVIITTLIASGPIVIDGEQDRVISGLHISNPNGDCIQVKGGSSRITIQNSEIGPCGDIGIQIVGSSNITVYNNYIHDTGTEGVWSYESDYIAVDSNVIIDVRSGYDMWGGGGSRGYLSFTNNFVKNVQKESNGVSGPGDNGGGNIVNANFVRGGGVRITDNVAINIAGQSSTEDLVNLYKSYGSASDPILIARNKFYGGGPSTSGGGIMLGDQDGTYQIAEDNILVNPGQYGLAIAGGRNNTLRNNQVYSDDQRSFANVGLYIWRFDSQDDGTKPGQCYSHTVELNQVTWWQGPDHDGNGQPATRMASWYAEGGTGVDGLTPNCGSVAGWNNNKFDTDSAQPANLDDSLWNPAWDTPAFLPQNPFYY
ncbi:MAG TPA: right-handed parallel beta-helix repeat-containing protein [Gammaproteobacteria bacterium]|nr:right-handed parallel beta-helix repeat-containing protein [Gammaproteobacteria bacterium]